MKIYIVVFYSGDRNEGLSYHNIGAFYNYDKAEKYAIEHADNTLVTDKGDYYTSYMRETIDNEFQIKFVTKYSCDLAGIFIDIVELMDYIGPCPE